jgi:hypothetical protein
MRPRIALLAIAVLAVGAAVGLGVATGGAAVTGEWTIHLTSPSGDVLNTTITTPTTTTSTTSSTTSTTSSTSTTTVPPPGPGYPSLTRVDWSGDFDPGCQLIGGAGGWDQDESGSDHPGTASIDRAQVAEGNCSARYSTPGGSGTGRAEVQRASMSVPVTLSYEQLLLIPTRANNGPGHGVLSQTKQGGSGGGCFNGGLTLDKDTHRLNFSTVGSCSAGSNKHDLGVTPFGRWIAVRVDETFSNSGHVTVRIDPDGQGPAGYAAPALNVATDTLSGDGLKLRQGLYHDLDPTEAHVWGDGFELCIGGCPPP